MEDQSVEQSPKRWNLSPGKCRDCGQEFERTTPNQQYCSEHRKIWIVNGVAVPRRKMSPEQGRAYERYMKGQLRQQNRLKSDSHSKDANSLVELDRKEALQVLSEVGIQNQHVAETVFNLLEVAVRHYRLPMNDFVVRNGLTATLKAVGRA